MPRAVRVQDAGFLHHIISKGNNSQPLFRDDSDYKFYLNLLEEARKTHPCHIYNYVLLDNAVNLLIEPLQEGNLSRFMEMVSKNYAKYFNKKYNQTGHVFQGRFKSFLIQADKFFITSCRYISYIPADKKIVADPKNHRWSAFNLLAHGKRVDLRLDIHELYINLGANDFERQVAFRALIANYHGEHIDFAERRADILGDKQFKQKVRKK